MGVPIAMSASEFSELLNNPFFNAYWSQCPDNLFVLKCLDDDFHIVAINESQARAMDLTVEAFSDIPLRGVFPEELYHRFTSNYRRCVETGEVQCYEEPYQNAQGEFSYYETLLTPIFDDHGKVTYIAGRARNITDKRRLVQTLEEEKQHAEKAREVRTAFLANMSHEMRTPLNGISGAFHLLLNSRDEQEKNQLASMVQSSIDHLSRLTNDILDYAKVNAGSLKLEMSEFMLERLAEDVISMLNPMARDNRTEISCCHQHAGKQTIQADYGRIRQIITNLLTNAIKFTPGGRAELTLDLEAQDEQHQTLNISVRDNGIGISDEDIQKLFRPFTQLDNSSTRKVPGAGLGLAICKELCRLMGGDIRVASSPGQGTEFQVSLPVRIPAGDAASGASTDETSSAIERFNGKVLLVEDNQVNQLVARKMLERLGLTVICVDNGEEALNTLAESTADLIMMDWHMPVMDGLTATRRLRQQNSVIAGIPVIGITANAMTEHKQACLDAGMNAVLTKPLMFEDLRDVLSNWLETPLTDS